MNSFMDENLFLSTDTARELYGRYAKDAPIIDYHCHIDPAEICEDRRYESITELWLGRGGSFKGDHYKWRLMRAGGVPEEFITGSAPDRERFIKWAQCLEVSPGNPLYIWSHMELKKYFGFEGTLTAKNAGEVYDICAEKLKQPGMSARRLILQSNVRLICTTDDPADTLEHHQKLKADESFPVKVLPAFRPDRAKSIEKPDFPQYIAALGKAAGMDIKCFDDLKEALSARMDFFAALGCRVSDHGFERMECEPCTDGEADCIFRRALAGESLSESDKAKYSTALMLFLGAEYARRGWVMQLHYGAKRNNSAVKFRSMGADVGCDCINSTPSASKLADLLNALEERGALPKAIVYNLDPAENTAVDSVIGCFQNGDTGALLQHGAAWWFNDNERGIKAQLTSLAEQGSLGSFVGMLTDSRSLLSYTRHDYFRRILCDLLGGWAERGEYPRDLDALGKIVTGVCFDNANSYFKFGL